MKELQDTRPAAERFRFEWDPYAQANLRSVAWEVDSYNGYCMNQPLYLEQFRMAQGKNPERYRDLLNVRYRLQQLQNQEQMRRLGPAMPAWARPFAQQFGMAVEQRSNALPRVWFVPAAVVMADSNAIERVMSPHFDPRAELVLAPDSTAGTPLATNPATRGSAALTAYDHTRMTADSTADGPGYAVQRMVFQGLARDGGRHCGADPARRCGLARRAGAGGDAHAHADLSSARVLCRRRIVSRGQRGGVGRRFALPQVGGNPHGCQTWLISHTHPVRKVWSRA